MIKSVDEDISIPLTHVVNLLLESGTVPNAKKCAKVISISKSGNENTFCNYRQISILPAVSKILEKVVANKLLNFINSTNQYYEHQYDFHGGHSTIHAIIHLLIKVDHENDAKHKKLIINGGVSWSKQSVRYY